MKATKGILLTCILIMVALGVLVIGCQYVSYNNKEVELRQLAEAQRGKVEGVHDAMWKIISQKAQVSNEYKNGFDSIYTHIISGRYTQQKDGSLMKWIKESNPNFDISLYKDLMESIEVERTKFMKAQERMIDIKRQHDVLCTTFPSKWFISNTSPIQYTIVSSSHSKEAMESGVDDDTSLFK